MDATKYYSHKYVLKSCKSNLASPMIKISQWIYKILFSFMYAKKLQKRTQVSSIKKVALFMQQKSHFT